jgi:UDP-3-O-[3-hydroxymyristoyl] N-acetylglucosamine deacetylase
MREKGTIQKEVCFSGVGIHSGEKVDLILKPSLSGEIIFRRTDLNNLELNLDAKKIESKNSTNLVSKGCEIQTLEHLMAVLFMSGINSLIVELNGSEIPAMDGSATPFVREILRAGIRQLPDGQKSIKILQPFVIQEKVASVSFHPDQAFKITYSIEYDHPLIRRQELGLTVTKENFITEIAPARTFGFLKDVPALRAQGLTLGGSLDNAVVLDELGVISGPLRFPDEFVRHKILDLIGDLSLLAFPLVGHCKADKAGHRLHLKAVRFLLDNPEYWTFE